MHETDFVPQACNFIKRETLAQVFSCEFCETSKNTFSYRTPPVAASVALKMIRDPYNLNTRFLKIGSIIFKKLIRDIHIDLINIYMRPRRDCAKF